MLYIDDVIFRRTLWGVIRLNYRNQNIDDNIGLRDFSFVNTTHV